jgi:hypothetical protein
MGHNYYDREDGLAHCKVCKCAEGSLALSCPGYPVGIFIEQLIYDGYIDYHKGLWFQLKPFDPTVLLTILNKPKF